MYKYEDYVLAKKVLEFLEKQHVDSNYKKVTKILTEMSEQSNINDYSELSERLSEIANQNTLLNSIKNCQYLITLELKKIEFSNKDIHPILKDIKQFIKKHCKDVAITYIKSSFGCIALDIELSPKNIHYVLEVTEECINFFNIQDSFKEGYKLPISLWNEESEFGNYIKTYYYTKICNMINDYIISDKRIYTNKKNHLILIFNKHEEEYECSDVEVLYRIRDAVETGHLDHFELNSKMFNKSSVLKQGDLL